MESQRPAYEPPLGAIETTLARLWSEALAARDVGRGDLFTQLGGSLDSATWVVGKIKQLLGASLAAGALLQRQPLSEVAAMIREMRRRELTPITRVPRSEPQPLSFAQQRLWFVSRMQGASEAYHVPLAYRLRGILRAQVLHRALHSLVQRHEALRTRFPVMDGQGVQQIDPPERAFTLREDDLSIHPDAQQRLQAQIRQDAREPFDLEQGPSFRARLIRLAAEDHVLILTLHHINCDGASIETLLRELGTLYRALTPDAADPLPPLSIQYADHAAWQRKWLSGTAMSAQSAYWKEQLTGAPTLLELPTDRNRPAQQVFAGDAVELEIDAALTAGLRSLSRRTGTTLFTIVLTGWALVLSRLSGQDEVVIGTPAANRTRAEVEGLIGCFANTLALRIDVSGDPTLEQLLARIRTVTLEAQEHQELPFEQVVELIRPERSVAYTPLFQVMLDWKSEPRNPDMPGLEVSEIPVPVTTAQFDLTLSLGETGDRIVGRLSYATALFDAGTMRRHVGYIRHVLTQMTCDVGQAEAA